jgi:hypothetical protein
MLSHCCYCDFYIFLGSMAAFIANMHDEKSSAAGKKIFSEFFFSTFFDQTGSPVFSFFPLRSTLYCLFIASDMLIGKLFFVPKFCVVPSDVWSLEQCPNVEEALCLLRFGQIIFFSGDFPFFFDFSFFFFFFFS